MQINFIMKRKGYKYFVISGNERTGIHGAGILCRNPGCVRHSSSCTLLSQNNRNNDDDAIQRQRGMYVSRMKIGVP